MRNYIILNDRSSEEIPGLLIQELPPISKPLLRNQIEEIDGRDGDIVMPLGYAAYDKDVSIGLYGKFDVDDVIEYFNSEGKVVFSNEPDKYYKYQVLNQIDFERLVRYRTATVTMHCQPFKYSATEQPITEDVSGTVSDEGTNFALENTAEAPFNTLDLKGNTEQNGTPTPDAPVVVQTVTGENVVKVTGKNILKPSENLHASRQGLTNVVNDDGSITTSGKPTADWNNIVYPNIDMTDRLEDGATYTISQRVKTNKLYLQFNARNKNTGTVQYISLDNATSKSFIVDKSSYTYSYTIQSPLITTWGDDTLTITNYYQLEKSSQATDFEPYQEQRYEVNLGKNLFDKNAITTGYYINSSGSLVPTGGLVISDYIPVEPNTPYTYSGSTNEPNYGAKAAWYTADKTWISSIDFGHSGTITAPANAYYFRTSIRLNPDDLSTYQFEKGSTATGYAAFFTPIELCAAKLHNTNYGNYFYRDNNGDWYIHKEIGKQVVDASAITLRSNYTNVEYAQIGKTSDAKSYGVSGVNQGLLCTHAKYKGGIVWNSTDAIGYIFDMAVEYNYWIGFAKGTGLDAIKAALGGCVIYYPLATPTNTKITNKTLIEQLDDIYYHAHAYKGRTHVISLAATGNVPLVIAAEVVEDNESTITNAGNYLSKPKITVYGSGDISLYINDMHVLQITLGDEGHITIDTAQMEAYKDTIDNLKNRLVIGDYSNARLKPGANKIHFTGKVTKYVVEDYSRWL